MNKRIRLFLPILVILAMLASTFGMAIPVGASQITATKEHTDPFAPNFYYVGDTIYYEMTVVNPPANTATNTIVEIWDTLPDGQVVYFIQEGIDPPLVQAPGDVEYFYGSYEVDEADIEWIPLLSGYGVKNQFEARGYDSESDDVQALVTKNSNVIRPEISIEKLVDFDNDGIFTDLETYYGGEPADWAIVVTNTGFDPVYGIIVTDDNGTNHGPFDLLNPGDSEIIPVYTTYPMAGFLNTACAEGEDDLGNPVGPVCNPAEVLVLNPEICIEKLVDCNGDGTFGDEEMWYAGDMATWKVIVSNCGDSDLFDIVVTDDNGHDFGLPFDLAAGADPVEFTYQTQVDVDTTNVAYVTAYDELGGTVYDEDGATNLVINPEICIEKLVDCNGDQVYLAEDTGSYGDTPSWYIKVTNCGDSPLLDVMVSDTNGMSWGPFDLENPGDFWEIYYDGDPIFETTTNEATASAEDILGGAVGPVYDSATNVVTGGEGCTPGYWKNNAKNWNHSAWVGYLPGDSFETVFGVDVTLNANGKNTYPTPTLLQALDANGGGINALARHAVAALLNISNPDISYGIGSTAALITMVHDAIVSGDEAQIDALHVLLADYNEAGCPLNQRGEPLMDGIV